MKSPKKYQFFTNELFLNALFPLQFSIYSGSYILQHIVKTFTTYATWPGDFKVSEVFTTKRKTGISSSSGYCPTQRKNLFFSETGLIEVEV